MTGVTKVALKRQAAKQMRRAVKMQLNTDEMLAANALAINKQLEVRKKAWGEKKYKAKLVEDIKKRVNELKNIDFKFGDMAGSFILNPKILDVNFSELKVKRLEEIAVELGRKIQGLRFDKRTTHGLKLINSTNVSEFLVYKPYSDLPFEETPIYTMKQLKQIELAIAKANKAREEKGGRPIFKINEEGVITKPVTTFIVKDYKKIIAAIKAKGTWGNINSDWTRLAMGFFKSITAFLELYEPGASENQDLVVYALKKIMKMDLNTVGQKLFYNSATLDFGGYLDSDGSVFKNINIDEFYRVFDLNLNIAKNRLSAKNDFNERKLKRDLLKEDITKELYNYKVLKHERLVRDFTLNETERQSYINLVSDRAKTSVNDILDRIDANET